MSSVRHMPVPGERYRHFKGGLYQIVTIAKHSETLEPLVIYQALYEDYECYARPLDMFMGDNDMGQKRFELLSSFNGDSDGMKEADHAVKDKTELLLRILDCKKSKDKLELMRRYRDDIDSRLMGNLAAAFDIVIDVKNDDEIFEQIVQYLETKARFETERLR